MFYCLSTHVFVASNKIFVGLYDSNSIKNAFDDVLLEHAEKKKLEINHSYTDLKIILGLICVGLGTLAQFYPRPFPKESYYPVALLVSMYDYVISFLMRLQWKHSFYF